MLFNKQKVDDKLIKIYEHFFELQKSSEPVNSNNNKDLAILPKVSWYDKLKILIEGYGYENYRNHVKETLEVMLDLQAKDNSEKRRKKSKGISYYADGTAPTHFYFYSSESSRCLKGVILSVSCVPDPILLKLLEQFAIECPFLTSGISQAPTGLYIYDIAEVFSKLKMSEAIPYLVNLKSKIKQTYAQKRFEKYLKGIAKTNKIDFDKVIEIGLPDYGFNHENVFVKKVGEYEFNLSFPKYRKKLSAWINLDTQKKQKSIPKELKTEFPETLKYIKTHIKAVEAQLSSQEKRIENQYFSNTNWEIDYWKEKYLDHPFIGILSKNLVWLFSKGNNSQVGLIIDKNIVDIQGKIIAINQFDSVKLWHPLHQSNDSIDMLKKHFESNGILQPFKQIDREFYDSNFIQESIGIILKKSVLAQLCKSRNWTSSAIHNLKIPSIGLTAKMLTQDHWDGTRGMYGGSKNVEFLGVELLKGKDTISPEQIDAVVLSEILRDIDLFISVAKEK